VQTSASDDPTGPIGVRLLVQSDGDRVPSLTVRTKAPTLLLPVHGGIAEIETGGIRQLVDRASWVLVPAGTRAIALTRECGASASSLLRTFKRELDHAPLGYVRARRLDESLLLLKWKRYAVGEVATMVGYKNFAAFSQAFRTRFGMTPSQVGG
jgi:AraC-like DNA-binding protein